MIAQQAALVKPSTEHDMIKNTLPPTDLTLSDFRYDLPQERIAQTPVEPRDSSRLMVLDRKTGTLEHRIFRDIVDYLDPGDTLVKIGRAHV